MLPMQSCAYAFGWVTVVVAVLLGFVWCDYRALKREWPKSVYLRYFQGMTLDKRTEHDRLTWICFIDYDREISLVAERREPHTDERRIIALGNLTKMPRRNDCEIAAITSDDCQGRGLGSEMMRRLLRIARDEDFDRVIATTLPENTIRFTQSMSVRARQ
ncbi:MAG: GNAT family N-acetyltransferase [Terriglobales bacterium]